MYRNLQFTLIFLSFMMTGQKALSQNEKTLVEKLGYPKNTKLLIIHADDIGVSHSENMASITALEKGIVNSGSVMVPCPWFPEIAAYSQKHPSLDLGIHLTLTAEWKYYKWKPVLPVNEVPSLVNEHGFFYDNAAEAAQKANIREAEAEVTAQIVRSMAFGLYPTHLDSHMGTLFRSKELFEVYLKAGRKFRLPVFVPKIVFAQAPQYKELITEQDIVVDETLQASPADYKEGMEQYYIKSLKSLQPGVCVLLIHLAYDEAEMQAVTIDHPDYGATWRQKDVDFFTSDKCKKILQEENIQLITWKKIGELLRK